MKNQVYSFREGVRDGLPIGLGYLSVSFGFGIAVVAAGLSPLVAALISMTNETSAGQLAGLGVIVSCGPLIEMILTQLVINIRYSLMGISLTQRLDDSFTTPWRLLLSFSITDEIFAVASTKRERVGTHYFSGLCTLPYAGWTLGTVLGAVAGTLLPPIISGALGIMLYGMFLAIIIPPAKKQRGVLVAVLAAITLSCLFRYLPLFDFLSDGFSLIISAVLGAALAAWLFPAEDDARDTETTAGEVTEHE